MPIDDRVDDRVAPAFSESGNTFGEGMDRAALQLRRTDAGKTEAAQDELHTAGSYVKDKSREQRETFKDYSHHAADETKGLFSRIGDWFSHKTDEVKDSHLGTTVSHAGSGLEAKIKEEEAYLKRKSENASERHDDSFLTTLGHKAEEAKQYGEEKLHGFKAGVRKEQVKDDLGISKDSSSYGLDRSSAVDSPMFPDVKAPASSDSSSLFPSSSSSTSTTTFSSANSDNTSALEAEVRRLQDAQHIVTKPDMDVMHRLAHRVIDGKQMHPEHIGPVLGTNVPEGKFPDPSSLTASDAINDTSNMVSGIDINGIHTASRDAIRAQNQAERDLFHGRGDLMNSGSADGGVKFDAAIRPKFGENSKASDTINEMVQDANQGRSEFSRFRYDPKIENVSAEVDPAALFAFRTEDF